MCKAVCIDNRQIGGIPEVYLEGEKGMGTSDFIDQKEYQRYILMGRGATGASAFPDQ